MTDQKTTYELQLRFDSAAAKRAALGVLAVAEITWFAEGVVDGVDVQVDEQGPPAFEDEATDTTPVFVWDYAEAPLAALAETLAAVPGGGIETKLFPLPTEAWQRAWDEDQEQVVTQCFAVVPPARAESVPAGLIPLLVAPGTAFGSGKHATTQVALEALESLPKAHARSGFLDVGTGTGVLAIAAAKLGFTRLVGTEIDPDVLAEARANAALNAVEMELLVTAVPPAGERYAVVAANILVPVLHQLMPVFVERLAPGGTLLLAGFIEKEAGPLLATAAECGLVLAARHACRGWIGLSLRAGAG